MNEIDIFSVPPEKAIAYLKKKGLAPAFKWTDLWKEDHDTAFTVAKMMDVELLQDVKDALEVAIENGETMQDFTDKIYPLMEAKGWIGWKETVDPDTGEVVEAELGTPRRVELIFRQNMGVAYEKGRWEEAQETKDEFPMMRYVATQDMRTRDEHAAWDGITLPVDHEFWKTHSPKNGWNCFRGDVKVITPTGLKRIDSMAVGDLVLGGSGNFKPIDFVHLSEFHGELIRYSIEGVETFSTPNHRILTTRGWMRASQIVIGDELLEVVNHPNLYLPIGDIKKPDSMRSDIAMASPRQAASESVTLNTDSNVGKKDINPEWGDVKIMNRSNSKIGQNVDHLGFLGRLLRLKNDMCHWIFGVHQKSGLTHFLSNLWSSCGCGLTKLFRNFSNPFAILFGFSKAGVLPFVGHSEHGVFHKVASLFFPGLIVNPLRFNSLATVSDGNVEEFHQTHESSVIDFPFSTNGPERQKVFNVGENKGVFDGSPLNRFNSLYDFSAWARSCHNVSLRKIISISKIPYNGTVYNLSIPEDNTYHVESGVVHNCRCSVIQLTKEDSRKLGGVKGAPEINYYDWENPRTGKVEKVPEGIDPGWDFNSGTASDARLEKDLKEREAEFYAY